MHVEACKDSEWLIQTDLAKGGYSLFVGLASAFRYFTRGSLAGKVYIT